VKYPWEEQFQAAMDESDAAKRPRLIAIAETAMYDRIRTLNLKIETGVAEEQQALSDALSRLT
jgi:hypothetical protein